MQFAQVMHAIECWYRERNISTDGLTVIFNLQEPAAAAHLDWELKKDIGQMQLYLASSKELDIRDFKMQGIRVKIESPLHEVIT